MTFAAPTVYSKPSCVQCAMTKKWLTARGVPFVEADILDPANLEAAKSLGHLSAPVVAYGDTVWAGFLPAELARVHADFVGSAA